MSTSTQYENEIHAEHSENNLEEKIKYFVEKYSPKLCILTPCYGGMCYEN
jgi:hypothetical protein